VQNELPGYLKTNTWELLFDRFADGNSLKRLVRLAKTHHQLIFLVLTANNEVLGGFLDHQLNLNPGKFVGTGDCCIFRWKANMREDLQEHKYEENRDKIHTDLTQLETFHSTNVNNFYFFCDEGGFGFGAE
jgi:TLD